MCTPLSENANLANKRCHKVLKKVISRTPNGRLCKNERMRHQKMCTPLSQNASLANNRFCKVAKKVISRTPNGRLRKSDKKQHRKKSTLPIKNTENNKGPICGPMKNGSKMRGRRENY